MHFHAGFRYYGYPHYFNDGGIYHPASNEWTAVRIDGAPVGRWYHTAIWTGSEMIIWGGTDTDNPPYLNDGGRYNPVENTWSVVATNGGPSGRMGHSAVWTGSEMIIWGGNDGLCHFCNDGWRYNPVSDKWVKVSSNGAPSARSGHTALWTGTEMIIAGGGNCGPSQLSVGRYNPASDSWTPVSDDNYLYPGDKAVWTGTQMLWVNSGGSGSVYDPTLNSWSRLGGGAFQPSGDCAVVWTGSGMICWGTPGAVYSPQSNLWTPMTTIGPFTQRPKNTAVWTGSEMIVFGGQQSSDQAVDLWSYTPPRLMYLYLRP